MPKIAMVGDRNSILPFKAFGFDLFPTSEDQDSKSVLSSAVSGEEEYAVVFVTEDVFNACEDMIAQFREEPLPAITVLPNVKGSQGVGLQQIATAIRTAIGSDIE